MGRKKLSDRVCVKFGGDKLSLSLSSSGYGGAYYFFALGFFLLLPPFLFAGDKKVAVDKPVEKPAIEKVFIDDKRIISDEEVLDFIASNSPVVKGMEKRNKKTWGDYITDNLKINLKGKYSKTPEGSSLSVGGTGNIGTTGGTSYDSGGSAIGIDFTFPLYPFRDPKEANDAIAQFEKAKDEVAKSARDVLKLLREGQKKLPSSSALLKAYKDNLEHIKIRVDAGVDYQKDMFTDYIAYLKFKNEYDTLTAQIQTSTASLLSMVEVKARDNLKAMLEGKEETEKKGDDKPMIEPGKE